MATVDPHFKLLWCHDDDEKAVKSLLCERRASLIPQSHSEATTTQCTSTESQPTDNEPQPKKRKIFTFIDEQKSLIQSSTDNNNEAE